MAESNEQLHIVLSPQQTRLVLEEASRDAHAHWESDCEPCGYTIEVGILPGIETVAKAKVGNQVLDLGEVAIELVNRRTI